MSNKSHIFQVWETNNQDFVIEGPRRKLVATFDTRAEAEQFAWKQWLLKNNNRDCDCPDDYSYTIKRVHR